MELQKKIYKKSLTRAFFLLAPAASHGWYKPFFHWLHEMAACCYFGVDHNSLSRLADRTPYSSSALPYITLLLPFYLDKIIQVQLPFSLLPFWTKIFQVQFLFSLLVGQNFLSSTLILQKYSKTIPNSVVAANSIQSRKNILSPIFFLT